MNEENKKPIRSYRDLDVYNGSYESSIVVMTKVVPKLPKEEKYDLADQFTPSIRGNKLLFTENLKQKITVI